MVKKYTTLNPRNEKQKKNCVRSIPCNTDFQLITDTVKEYDFIARRVGKLKRKNRIIGKHRPLYMINVLSLKHFNKIYNINDFKTG